MLCFPYENKNNTTPVLYDKKTKAMEVLCQGYIEGTAWYVSNVFIMHCVTFEQGVALQQESTHACPHPHLCYMNIYIAIYSE